MLTLLGHLDVPARVAAPAGELVDAARAAGHATLTLTDPAVRRLGDIGKGIGAAGTGPALLGAAAALAGQPLWGKGPVVSFSMWLHLPLALAGRARGARVVLDLHDGPFTAAGAAVQSAAAFAATRVVATSRTALDHVGRWPHRRAAVVPRPVELPAGLGAAGETTGDETVADGTTPLRAVIVGRLDPEKRVDVALEAQRRARAAGVPVELTVVGAPHNGEPGLDHLRARWPDARFTGRLPHDAVLTELTGADLLVSTATGEAFGRTVVEAALLGVPSLVVGGGPAENVRDGRTGLLATGTGPDEVAAGLARAAADRAALTSMGAAARAELGALCDPATVTRQWWAEVAG
ncbi:hypothetical protein Cma02nite_19580 [Cellulomonas marina]|nr:hypothetical protein Cma02nite_19580 [Cellulomonas marina]